MKHKLILILPLILIAGLFLFLFPRYHFNQLESKIRQGYLSIENTRDITGNDIEERSGSGNFLKVMENKKI